MNDIDLRMTIAYLVLVIFLLGFGFLIWRWRKKTSLVVILGVIASIMIFVAFVPVIREKNEDYWGRNCNQYTDSANSVDLCNTIIMSPYRDRVSILRFIMEKV